MVGANPELQMENEIESTLATLNTEIKRIGKNADLKFFSQWRYGRLLDQVAGCVRDQLKEIFPGPEIGCSLFYLQRSDEEKNVSGADLPEEDVAESSGVYLRYVLGGSSTHRWTMDYTARSYDMLQPESLNRKSAPETSFTAYSLRRRVPLFFNRFQKSKEQFKRRVNHTTQACEHPEDQTHSYIAIPGYADRRGIARALQKKNVRLDDLPRGSLLAMDELPIAHIRITFDQESYATRANEVLSSTPGIDVLASIFDLISAGRSALIRNSDPAIAIADLNSEMMRYRDREYEGLGELVLHLQALFGECECSVFLAHRLPRARKPRQEVRLYLAASSARSASEHHRDFREHFYENREHYTCYFDLQNEPLPQVEDQIMGKTGQAYCEPDSPQLVPLSKGSGSHSGHGEYPDSGSFIAVAIPSNNPASQLPYGVIRWVRREQQPFNERDRNLVVAIARTLSFWMDYFPVNDRLKITCRPELKKEILRSLFEIEKEPGTGNRRKRSVAKRKKEADIEFTHFLRKVFVASDRIEIKKAYGGYSQAIVLLVGHDAGLDLILKCAHRDLEASRSNEITLEAEHYSAHVEGKLELSHNVIYLDKIRETNNINGFATTFLGGEPLNDLVKQDPHAETVYDLVGIAVDRIVNNICGWWYDQAKKQPPMPVCDFIEHGFKDYDRSWHLGQDRLDLLDGAIFEATQRIRRCTPDKDSTPARLWSRFIEWSEGTNARVKWSRSVTHGDLHGGNIFVEKNAGKTWLIDFARTDERVSIFDLAQLEAYAKFELLPALLFDNGALKDPAAFVEEYIGFERTCASQRTYDTFTRPDIKLMRAQPDATFILSGASRLVTRIRGLAFERLCRRGSMLDYRIALLIVSHWYLNVRGLSGRVRRIDSLGTVMALESIREIVDSIVD